MDKSMLFYFLIFAFAAMGTFVFQFIKRRQTELQEVDERVLYLFKTYVFRVVMGSIVIGVILLSGYTIAGYQSVPVSYIWLYLLISLFVLTFVAKLAQKK